jgi:hypothetical protein
MGVAHLGRVDFGTVKPDELKDSVVVGLLGTFGLTMITRHLPQLVHQRQARIRFESRLFLGFGDIEYRQENMENSGTIFPCFTL